jgi:penicillin amidase
VIGAGRARFLLLLLLGWPRMGVAASSTLALPGLSAPVRLLTDVNGIPHVHAANLSDLYMAWGFVTARDRMWELEASRRAGQGRMWEWLGNRSLRADGGAQLFEFAARSHQAWERERSDPATRLALERFAAGVNAYLALCKSGARPWAAELARLGRQPEDWRAEDAYLLLYGMGVLLDLDLPEVAETDTLRVHGAGWYDRRRRFESDFQYTTIPDSAARRMYGAGAERSPARPSSAGGHIGWRAPGISFGDRDPAERASDIFAVGAGRATRHLPLLANDVHLNLTTPSPLYAIHVTVDGVVDAAGACVPGLPIIVSGRNRTCAWGITSLGADVIDLYADTLSADGHRVRSGGQWVPVREADYTMRFAFWGLKLPPFGQKRRYTPHGPVVALDTKRRIAYAARWAAFERPITLHDVLGLERSHDAAELARRASSLVTPALNIVAADVQGHVRYQSVGAVPHRAFVAPRGAFPSDGRHEWGGLIATEAMPGWSLSPRDFVSNGNNLPVGGAYAESFPRYDWAQDRAARIAQRLAGDDHMTLADMASVQNDIYSRGAERILPRLLEVVAARTPAERAALDTLRAWDRRAARIQTGPSFFRAWTGCLYRNTGLGDAPGLALAALEGRAPEALAGKSPSLVATAALDSALAALTRLLGPNPVHWKWGWAHRGRFRHSLAWLDASFQPAAIPMDGDNSTPSVGASHLPTDVYVSHGPAWRHVVDLADPDSSLCVMPPGNAAGRHAFDHLALWAHHGYVPLYVSWDLAEKIKEDEVELVPAR